MNASSPVNPQQSGLYGQPDFHFAGSVGHSHRDFVLMAIEHEVETRGSDRKVANLHPLEERRKHWTDETHKPTWRIDL